MTIADSRAPGTVRAAALLMCVSSVLEFSAWVGGAPPLQVGTFQARWWPWPQLLSLVVTIFWAYLTVRLNGLTYWFTVIVLGMALTVLVASVALTSLKVVEGWPIAEAGVVAWLQILLMGVTFGLLVAKPSVRAPWTITNGFSRS